MTLYAEKRGRYGGYQPLLGEVSWVLTAKMGSRSGGGGQKPPTSGTQRMATHALLDLNDTYKMAVAWLTSIMTARAPNCSHLCLRRELHISASITHFKSSLHVPLFCRKLMPLCCGYALATQRIPASLISQSVDTRAPQHRSVP